jgi:hypothetical protein
VTPFHGKAGNQSSAGDFMARKKPIQPPPSIPPQLDLSDLIAQAGQEYEQQLTEARQRGQQQEQQARLEATQRTLSYAIAEFVPHLNAFREDEFHTLQCLPLAFRESFHAFLTQLRQADWLDPLNALDNLDTAALLKQHANQPGGAYDSRSLAVTLKWLRHVLANSETDSALEQLAAGRRGTVHTSVCTA